ncbi:MAG: rRNA pseudouridine synthase [Muribaculaceae bacterium]|nr:rRNA pseudouridine synthase [Muribaculaceae bacterium]
METNSNGEIKRPKRPRIGSSNADGSASTDSRFEKVSYGNDSTSNYSSDSNESEGRPQRPYQPRPRYNNGYNSYNSYNNNSSYQRPQSGYQRPRYERPEGQEGSYRPRYNPETYRDNNRNEGYQPRPRYNNNNNNRYNSHNSYNSYNSYNNNRNENRQPRQEGGYQQRQEGGYQPRQEGGYQQRPRYNNNNNRQGGYQQRPGGNRYNKPQGPRQQQRPGKSFTPRPKRIFYEEPEVDPNSEIRLNKFIANAGICSRREADEYIEKGEIKVNGQVVTELGTKITPKDVVEFQDKVVTTERKCYVLLNKPKDCVTTADDPNGRLTVMDLVKNACEERIYPVGRLDRNTTGVLLLTNDGDLASKLTHPQYVKKKIYHVWTDKDIEEDDMQRIADGIELDDGPIHADAISYATETDRNQAGIEIHSGRNRIVRRIFESLGYHVTKLDRVYFAGLTKKNLPRGRWRYLTQEEVNFLKMGSFE